MGSTIGRDNRHQLASIRIEKLENAEKKYLDQIHNLKEAEREYIEHIGKMQWKLNNGITRNGYINLLKAKNKKEPTKEQLNKFDNADINGDGFLTFLELESG